MKKNITINENVISKITEIEHQLLVLSTLCPYKSIEFTGTECSFLVDGANEILKMQVKEILKDSTEEEAFNIRGLLFDVAEKVGFFVEHKEVLLKAKEFDLVKGVFNV